MIRGTTSEKTFALVLVAGVVFGTFFLFGASNWSSSEDTPNEGGGTTEVVRNLGEDGADGSGAVHGPYGGEVSEIDAREVRSNMIEEVFPNYRSPEEDWFKEVSADVGYNYTDTGREHHEGEAVAGVFVADVTNDYRDDLLVIGGDSPVLFENTLDGFVERKVVSEPSEVTSALFFDHDNDGYEDLYLLSDDRSVFLENVGGGFEEREVGLETEYESVRGASAADYTGNGCLDVFVVQAGDWTEKRPAGYDDRNVTIDDDNGNGNRLFAGDCDGFEETTDEAGIEGNGWSLATSFVDLTNDGAPDIHVANDFNNDVLYLNQGDGTFERRVMPEFTNRNGMSSEVADVTGNGYLDIFVTNIHYGREVAAAQGFDGRAEGNNLLINQGNGSFTDRAEEFNVQVGGWGWSAVLADFDNDGHLDLLHSVTATLDNYPAFWEGDEHGFTRVNSSAAGFGRFAGFGIAVLDYNLDGSLDVAVSNRGTAASGSDTDGTHRLYENLNEGGFLRVSVEGEDETDIGTVVTVSGEEATQTRVKSSRTDYMSQSSRFLHFGLGNEGEVSLSVDWNDGTTDKFENVEPNTTVSVSQDGLEVRGVP